MAPSFRFLGVVLTAFFLFFVSPSNACDGIQPTCPPEYDSVRRYHVDGDGSGQRGLQETNYLTYRAGLDFVSGPAAVAHFAGWVNSAIGGVCHSDPNQNPPLVIRSTYEFGSYRAPDPMPHPMLTGSGYVTVTRICGTARFPSELAVRFGLASQQLVCKNPLYPIYNSADNLCHKNTDCESGKTQWSTYTNITASSVCVDMGNGSLCKGRPDGVSVCAGNPEKCWANVLFSGEMCPASDSQKGPQEKCATAPDGRKVCASDSPNTDAKDGPCVQTDRGVICAKTESPQSNCTKNPSEPSCLNPDGNTKCGFVGTTLVCSNAPNNCGTMAGQSVCICQNGGSRPWGGGASSCASGGGTDPVVGGGGGSGKEQKINFAGRCGSGDTLNLDCFFENSTDIKPQKGTPEFTELDQATQKIGEPFEHGIGEGAGLFAGVMPGTGSCPALSLDGIPHVGSIAIRMPCDQMTLIRLGFEWLLNIGVVWYVWRRFSETI